MSVFTALLLGRSEEMVYSTHIIAVKCQVANPPGGIPAVFPKFKHLHLAVLSDPTNEALAVEHTEPGQAGVTNHSSWASLMMERVLLVR